MWAGPGASRSRRGPRDLSGSGRRHRRRHGGDRAPHAQDVAAFQNPPRPRCAPPRNTASPDGPPRRPSAATGTSPLRASLPLRALVPATLRPCPSSTASEAAASGGVSRSTSTTHAFGQFSQRHPEDVLIASATQVPGHLGFGVGGADQRGGDRIFVRLVLVARAQRERPQQQQVADAGRRNRSRTRGRLARPAHHDGELPGRPGGQVGQAKLGRRRRRAAPQHSPLPVPHRHPGLQRGGRCHLDRQLVGGRDSRRRWRAGGGELTQLQHELILDIARARPRHGAQRAFDRQRCRRSPSRWAWVPASGPAGSCSAIVATPSGRATPGLRTTTAASPRSRRGRCLRQPEPAVAATRNTVTTASHRRSGR